MDDARLVYVSDIRYYSWNGAWYTDKGFPLEYLVKAFEIGGRKLSLWTFFGRLEYCPPPTGALLIDTSFCEVAFVGPRTSGRGIANYLRCLPSYLKHLHFSLRTHNVLWINANFVAGWLCLAFPWLLRSRITVSQSIGSPDAIVVNNRAKQAILRLVTGACIRRVHNACSINVFVSRSLKTAYGNRKSISWIVNDSSVMKDQIVCFSELRKELHSPPKVLYVGRLSPEKGVTTLISAIAQLEIPIELRIAGDGLQRQELQVQVINSGIANKVRFLGVIPWGEQLFSLMRDSDFLVLPSSSEGLALVLIEAMANGLVPIASAVGGIPEIIEDGVNGILVEPSNPEQICRAIQRLIQDDGLRARMQLAGLKVAAENTIENQRCRMFRDLGIIVKSGKMLS